MHDSVAQAKHLQCSLVLESTPQMCDVDESGIYSIDVLPDGILPESSVLSRPDFRKRGISIAEQLPEESLMALLPDRRAAANPDHVLTHRIEEARRAANRKRDDRQKRRQ